MKKYALLVYPEFSLQEVMSLAGLFRWEAELETEIIATGLGPVKSEEGIRVVPEKTTREFRKEDYACLILPGCSDLTQAVRDQALLDFLRSFQGEGEFPIGAICSGPVLLAKAGVLRGKPFTASIYRDLFDFCPFLERERFVEAPLVVAGNVVTAGGSNFNGFAVAMARQLGVDCPGRIFSGYMDDWGPEDYRQYLPPEGVEEMKAVFGVSP